VSTAPIWGGIAIPIRKVHPFKQPAQCQAPNKWTLDPIRPSSALRISTCLVRAAHVIIVLTVHRQYMPEERPPALIQLCQRLIPPKAETPDSSTTCNLSEGRKRKHPYGNDEQQDFASSQQENSEPSFKCYLLQISCLGPGGKDRAHPNLKQLLEHPKV
jgi:hypothetical protein